MTFFYPSDLEIHESNRYLARPETSLCIQFQVGSPDTFWVIVSKLSDDLFDLNFFEIQDAHTKSTGVPPGLSRAYVWSFNGNLRWILCIQPFPSGRWLHLSHMLHRRDHCWNLSSVYLFSSKSSCWHQCSTIFDQATFFAIYRIAPKLSKVVQSHNICMPETVVWIWMTRWGQSVYEVSSW